MAGFLERVTPIESLSLVHVCCTGAMLGEFADAISRTRPATQMVRHIESFRSSDGGYNTIAGSSRGTVYGCFLAAAGYGDAARQITNPKSLIDCIRTLRAADGGYANQEDMPIGLTPSTAAAATLLRHLSEPPDTCLADWLLACRQPDSGFFPTPHSPIPDLLSTATALHALSGMQVDLDPIKEPCLDFVDSLWTNQGAFYGNWTDDMVDTEYTYYGLLALGHLSL